MTKHQMIGLSILSNCAQGPCAIILDLLPPLQVDRYSETATVSRTSAVVIVRNTKIELRLRQRVENPFLLPLASKIGLHRVFPLRLYGRSSSMPRYNSSQP